MTYPASGTGPRMSRRTLIAGLAGSGLATPAHAMHPNCTPIETAYSAWLVCWTQLNDATASACDAAMVDHLFKLEDRLLALEPTSARDMLMQLLACSENGQDLTDRAVAPTPDQMCARIKRVVATG